jgi:hypothetical protein
MLAIPSILSKINPFARTLLSPSLKVTTALAFRSVQTGPTSRTDIWIHSAGRSIVPVWYASGKLTVQPLKIHRKAFETQNIETTCLLDHIDHQLREDLLSG